MQKIELKTPPWCPFCGQNVDKPEPPDERKLGEFNMGRCQCGAHYASDPTGFNIGAAMVECLVSACGDNWDLAWDLLPEEDYLTSRLEDYDEQTNQVVETRNLDGRLIRGVLYFVRLHKEVAELTESLKEQKKGGAGGQASRHVPLAKSVPVPLEPERDPGREKKRADKVRVREMVEQHDIAGLVDLCFDDKRTLRFLQRLLYDPDEARRWDVAYVMGQVYGRVSTRQPGMISDMLHRMFEACADSASTNWGIIEAVGEILAVRPDIFGPFVRHLLSFVNDASMQPQALWALGTIARPRPDLIRGLPFYRLFDLLDSPEPLVRGLALRLFGRIRATEIAGRVTAMQDDATMIVIYEEGQPRPVSLGQLAVEAMSLIGDKGVKE